MYAAVGTFHTPCNPNPFRCDPPRVCSMCWAGCAGRAARRLWCRRLPSNANPLRSIRRANIRFDSIPLGFLTILCKLRIYNVRLEGEQCAGASGGPDTNIRSDNNTVPH